ncbi:MAG: GAF domain-containing protein [Actinobacteria bacterium]|nr:GAF domain-containing protein [Actinomycetota bacterium]
MKVRVETDNIKLLRNFFWVFLVIASVPIAFNRDWIDLWPFVAVICSGAAINLCTYAIPLDKIREKDASKYIFISQLTLYLVTVALACGFSGGMASPLFSAFFLVLIVPAVNSTFPVTLYSCAVSIAGLLIAGAFIPAGGLGPAESIFIKVSLIAVLPVMLYLFLSRYHRQLRDREILATLYGISESLGKSLDLKDVLHRLLGEVDIVFNTDVSSIRLIDEEKQTLVVEASGAPSEKDIEAPVEISIGKGFIGSVAKTGEPFKVNDISKDPRFAEFPGAKKEIASALAAPVKIGDNTIGVISCASSQKRRFTDSDLELLKSVASLIAGSIERAQLYQQLLSKGELIVENMVDGIISIDREGKVILTNNSARELLNIEPGLGEPIEDVLGDRIEESKQFCTDIHTKMLEPEEPVHTSFTADLHLKEEGGQLINAKVSPIISQLNKAVGAIILIWK